MKKILFTVLALGIILLNAADLSFSAKTGDADFDLNLNDINVTAKADLKIFKTEISTEYRVEDKTIDHGLIELKMEPAELYLALEIANITKKEPAAVLKVYQESRIEGWGVIAEKMGVKPGSKEFKAIKKKTHYKKEKHKKANMKKTGGKTDLKIEKPIKESMKSGTK